MAVVWNTFWPLQNHHLPRPGPPAHLEPPSCYRWCFGSRARFWMLVIYFLKVSFFFFFVP